MRAISGGSGWGKSARPRDSCGACGEGLGHPPERTGVRGYDQPPLLRRRADHERRPVADKSLVRRRIFEDRISGRRATVLLPTAIERCREVDAQMQTMTTRRSSSGR